MTALRQFTTVVFWNLWLQLCYWYRVVWQCQEGWVTLKSTVKSSQWNASESYAPASVAFFMTLNLWIFLYLLVSNKTLLLRQLLNSTHMNMVYTVTIFFLHINTP